MGSDLRSTFQQLAPSPRGGIDFPSLLREGRRRQRNRIVAYAALVVILVTSAGVLAPGFVHRLQNGRTVAPGRTPSANRSREANDLAFKNLRPGWTRLPAPPEIRTEGAIAWSGRQLFQWGGIGYTGVSGLPTAGFIFDAQSQTWSKIAPSPLAPRVDPASAWTGKEFLVWGGSGGDLPSHTFFSDGAAYNPGTNTWRLLPPAPISARAPLSVWTGKELLVWGSTARGRPLLDGAAYDPSTNTWRKLPQAPIGLNAASAVWSGHEMIVVGAALNLDNVARTRTAMGAVYQPTTNRWRRLPNTNLSPQASTAAWDGKELIAWDYVNHSAAYDLQSNRWQRLPRVPLQPLECYPQSASVVHFVVGNYCGSTVVFDPAHRAWHDVSRRNLVGWQFSIAAAEPAVLLLGRDAHTDQKAMFAYRP